MQLITCNFVHCPLAAESSAHPEHPVKQVLEISACTHAYGNSHTRKYTRSSAQGYFPTRRSRNAHSDDMTSRIHNEVRLTDWAASFLVINGEVYFNVTLSIIRHFNVNIIGPKILNVIVMGPKILNVNVMRYPPSVPSHWARKTMNKTNKNTTFSTAYFSSKKP